MLDKVPTLPADQWTHPRCRHPLDWTNRSWRWRVFLRGRWRSDSVASDLRPSHQCALEQVSVSAQVGRHRCPTPHTSPGGHAPFYLHTTPENKKRECPEQQSWRNWSWSLFYLLVYHVTYDVAKVKTHTDYTVVVLAPHMLANWEEAWNVTASAMAEVSGI